MILQLTMLPSLSLPTNRTRTPPPHCHCSLLTALWRCPLTTRRELHCETYTQHICEPAIYVFASSAPLISIVPHAQLRVLQHGTPALYLFPVGNERVGEGPPCFVVHSISCTFPRVKSQFAIGKTQLP